MRQRRGFFALILAGLLFALAGRSALADDACRIAFDLGSSGIRAGVSGSSVTTRADIDYLGPLWAGRGLEETIAPTIDALRSLPAEGGFPTDCRQVGGGFSAWRLALANGESQLAATLEHIHAASDVAVLVIPQVQEGAYGYLGARRLLGARLTTSHVLDIGGGSLQIAGERTTFGETLGQKVWHRTLCQEIRNSESSPCLLQPMTGDELAIARALLAEKLAGVAAALPEPVTMTAISRPVSRGVLPAIGRLYPDTVGAGTFRFSQLSAAIERVARLSREETVSQLGAPADHVAYLLSDMLLVEGLLLATGGDQLQVAELDLTNLPGLLADDHAFAWEKNYDCYLQRLRRLGLDAYASDPATCE
ncbi:MAG: hypothetical protein ACM3X0_00650 [Bacteroidota bacterium]